MEAIHRAGFRELLCYNFSIFPQFPSKTKLSIQLQILFFKNALTKHTTSISIHILVNIVSGSFGWLIKHTVCICEGHHGTRTVSFLQEKVHKLPNLQARSCLLVKCQKKNGITLCKDQSEHLNTAQMHRTKGTLSKVSIKRSLSNAWFSCTVDMTQVPVWEAKISIWNGRSL